MNPVFVERNVAGKIRKDVLRKRVREEWARRLQGGKTKGKSEGPLAKL